MKIVILLIGLLVTSRNAFAGPSEAASGLRDEKSTKGLCTKDDQNQNEKWIKDGWCASIYDGLTNDCANDEFQQLKEKAKAGKIKGLDEYCPNYQSMASGSGSVGGGSSDAFANMMQQMIAMLAIAESSWDAKAHGTLAKDGKTTHPEGIFQLSADSVAGTGIYKCGCSEVKKGAAGDQQLKDDPKVSAKCGAYIAMRWMNVHSEVGGGSGDNSRGIGRYFQPFRDTDKDKQKWMRPKLVNFCQSHQDKAVGKGDGTPSGR